MKLSGRAAEALDNWVRPKTWYAKHPCDMDRWYKFVDLYQRDHGNEIDEVDLRETIEGKIGDTLGEDLRNIIRDRISLMYNILDFLKCTGR